MNRRIFTTALAVLFVVVLAIAAWQLAFVLLLAFAAILLAVLLRHTATFLADRTPLSIGSAIIVVIVAFLVVAGTFLFFAGPRIATQVSQVTDALPDAWDEVKNALKDNGWGHYILDSTPLSDDGPDLNVMGALEGTLSTTLSVLVNLVVVVTVGIYLAIDPKLYRVGVQHLFPKAHRERSGEILDALGDGLWYWLLGQFVDMAAVAIMTGAGLWLLGVPLPVALGVIAGVTNFIPYLGPFIGAAPAVVIAFAHDPMLALYAAGLFLVVQQLDSHVMMPIIQEHATAMPPALTILVVVAAGVLFGLLGVLLATPLLLVALILVQRVYVEDVLQDHDVEEVGG